MMSIGLFILTAASTLLTLLFILFTLVILLEEVADAAPDKEVSANN
jgi:hypothetical protein